MIFTITNAGLLAAASIAPGGPRIEITSFKLGSALGYEPSATDTELHGALLHSGVPSDYAVSSAHVVEWTLRIDDQIGDFNFGEVGLYLSDGTLFALAVLPQSQQKLKSQGATVGNVIQILAKLTLTNAAAIFTFPLNAFSIGKILEIPNVNFLTNPSDADSNAYIALSTDDMGNTILAYKVSDNAWAFTTHTFVKYTGTASTGATTQSMQSTAIPAPVLTVAPGVYLIQFITGTQAGHVRVLDTLGNGTATWVTALGGAPANGDIFRIYQSNSSFTRDLPDILTSHIASANPHPQYLTEPEGDARYAGTGHTHSHNGLTDLQGGAPGDRYHLTAAELTQVLAATIPTLTFIRDTILPVGSGTWIRPAGIDKVSFRLLGGSGGGGGYGIIAQGYAFGGGGGGGGAFIATDLIDAPPTLAYTVGGGGGGALGYFEAGGNGGPSSIAGFTASGGQGSPGGTTVSGGPGGQGGVANIVAGVIMGSNGLAGGAGSYMRYDANAWGRGGASGLDLSGVRSGLGGHGAGWDGIVPNGINGSPGYIIISEYAL